MIRSVRIEAGATGNGVKVIDRQTGAEIKGLAGLEWSVRPGEACQAVAQLVGVELSADADCVFQVWAPDRDRPKTVKRIEFEDGSVWPPED